MSTKQFLIHQKLFNVVVLVSVSPWEVCLRIVRLKTKGDESSLSVEEVQSACIFVNSISRAVNVEPSITYKLLLVKDFSIGAQEEYIISKYPYSPSKSKWPNSIQQHLTKGIPDKS